MQIGFVLYVLYCKISWKSSFILVAAGPAIIFPMFLQGIARKLVKAALHEAAKKREMRYSDLKKIDRGVRRHFHDDITVVVLFLDSHLVSRSHWHGPLLSVKGSGGVPASTQIGRFRTSDDLSLKPLVSSFVLRNKKLLFSFQRGELKAEFWVFFYIFSFFSFF